MFISVHFVFACLLTRKLNNPLAAFLVGLFSHFLLDLIPHGDQELGKKPIPFLKMAAVDLPFSCFSFFLIFNKINFVFPQVLAWGVLGAILPDIFLGLAKVYPRSRIFGFFKEVNEFFHKIIKVKISFKKGLAVQSAFFIFFLFLLFK